MTLIEQSQDYLHIQFASDFLKLLKKPSYGAVRHKYLPIIYRAQPASLCDASSVDNIMDDLRAVIYAADDKISTLLFYCPAVVVSSKLTDEVREKKEKKKINEISECK